MKRTESTRAKPGKKAGEGKAKKFTEAEVNKTFDILREAYPDAQCALNHENVFELLVAVALSAQTTDKSVNSVTPVLFEKYHDAKAMAFADEEEVRGMLKKIGMYKTKTKNLLAMAQMLVGEYDGVVPGTYSELVKLPGVGRKTANVVLSVGFGEQRIAVDTHVFRVSNKIGLVNEKDVLRTELALMEVIPKERWSEAHHSLIFHGRNCCSAINPKCGQCPIADLCGFV